MSKFTIDFFELGFLAAACIPPKAIARTVFWHKMIDQYHDQMIAEERKHLFDWIIKHPQFNLENDDCRLFYDRYNPDNQYRVHTSAGPSVLVAFKHANELGEEQYCTGRNRYIAPEYITKIEKHA